MTFEEDLTKRRIDVAAFVAGDPEKFAAWQTLYSQVHPNSFYAAVKMVINEVRRRFWLAEAPKPAAILTPSASKPTGRRALATVPSTASAVPDEPSPSVDRTPEPVPARPRVVIRNPSATPVADAGLPNDAQTPVNENIPLPNDNATVPEVARTGRARPIFRKPPGQPTVNIPATNASPIENIPAPADAPAQTDVIKPAPRPRPVFRKPTVTAENAETMPAENMPVADAIIPEAAATPAPELPEAPKPPRPRPTFKRPPAPDEPGTGN